MSESFDQIARVMNRRQFLGCSGLNLGGIALASMLASDTRAASPSAVPATAGSALAGLPHFPAKAKRIIYLCQSGAPSQLELFDYKPKLPAMQGKDLPASIRQGQRITSMTSGQKAFPVAASIFKFSKYGKSGAELSELLPHTSTIADEMCIIKSMHTEAINHDQAMTFLQTGGEQAGRPSFGSWISYGLGSINRDLPNFVVLTSRGTGRPDDQPLYDRLWGSGFLPGKYQGVKFRSGSDPVLYLSNPQGVDAGTRREMLDELGDLNRLKLGTAGDPEIATRIAQYEMAFRMQTSVPDLVNMANEPKAVLESYGPNVHTPGTYAFNCLLARRLSERGVRFVQLFHMGWDQHFTLPQQIRGQCSDTDQPTAALIKDLKSRGMLEDTLIIWGGEFGRTVYCQGELTNTNYGRDHHPRCFTMWLAGAGIKPGMTLGETDDFSYNIVKDPVHVHDLNATLLHCLGIDHTRLTYKYQGRNFRLTDVRGEVVKPILA